LSLLYASLKYKPGKIFVSLRPAHRPACAEHQQVGTQKIYYSPCLYIYPIYSVVKHHPQLHLQPRAALGGYEHLIFTLCKSEASRCPMFKTNRLVLNIEQPFLLRAPTKNQKLKTRN
jgi:hypothetical protein